MFGNVLAFQMTHQRLFVELIGSWLKTNEIREKIQLWRNMQTSIHNTLPLATTSLVVVTFVLFYQTPIYAQHQKKLQPLYSSIQKYGFAP